MATVLLLTVGASLGCDAGDGAAAVACTVPPEAPAGPVTVQTDCAAYAPADSLALTFRNASDRPYLYGPCGISLQRRGNEGWVEVAGCSFGPEIVVEGERGCACQSLGIQLRPGGESVLGLALFSGLAAGRYRVQVDAAPDEREPVLSFSNAFDVRR